jgi:hypothetical protein
MKSINILLISLLFSAFSMQAATITVNNENPFPGPGQFRTIDLALAAANAGDVILVKGTGTAYEDAHINKPITIVGNGYNPKTLSAYPSAMVSYFYINANIANVNIRGFSCGGGVYLTDNNDHINVEFCKFNAYCGLGSSNCDDVHFTNCIMGLLTGTGPTNVVIEHCIITQGLALGVTTNLVVHDNIFINPGQNEVFGPTSNAVIYNNIFYDALLTGGGATFTGCVISNNVMYRPAGTYPVPTNTAGNTGNTIGPNTYDINPNFISYTATSGTAAIAFAFTHDFHLNTGSPALTAGVGGTQIGIYAASFPFSMTGEPRIPAIRLLNITTPAVNAGGSINVNINASKAQAN